MTSASSVRSSSPSKGSASAVSSENAGSAISEKMKSQDASASNGTLPGTSKTHSSSSSGLENGSGSIEHVQKDHQEKLQALKQRKFDLEKLLGEKNLLLEQIQRQEQQIIGGGDYELDNNFHKTSSLNIRKKISTTSFKLPSNGKGMYATKERSGSVGDMEKKIRQEMISAQSLIPSNIDFTLIKSKRNTPYNDSLSVAQQQQLITKRQLYHDLDCMNMVAQPISIDAPATNFNPLKNHDLSVAVDPKFCSIKSMSHSPIAANGNPSQRCSPVSTVGTGNSGKYVERIASNVSSNYSMADRRNSMKSLQQKKNSPKQQRQDDRLSMVVNSSSLRECSSGALMVPLTRSDFDISSPMVALGNSNNFVYDYDVPKMQISAANVVYRTDVADGGGVPSVSHRQSSGSGTMRMPQQPQYLQSDLDEALISNHLLTNSASSNRQPIHMLMDLAPERYYAGISDVQPQAMGLGGFWKTLGKDRVWCRFDSSYDCSSMQSNSIKSKKTNANMRTTPIKSVSLGNFDVLNDSEVRDEMIEKISISSMNSEGNKKQKEKQWLETSLDGPSKNTARYLQRTSQNAHNLSVGHQSTPVPVTYTNNPSSNTMQQVHTAQITKPAGRMKPGSQPMLGIAKTQLDDCQVQRKGAAISRKASGYGAEFQENQPPLQIYYSRAPSSASDSASLKLAQDASFMTGATAIHHRKSPSVTPVNPLNNTAVNQAIHQLQVAKSIQMQGPNTLQFSSSPPSQPQPPLSTTNPRSPINAVNLSHHDLIRIESPKNMTVVQQAIFMPYKEVTKPFEMSDFYKYSTKFRQKDKILQQSQRTPQQQTPRHDQQQNSSHQPFHQKQVEVEQ